MITPEERKAIQKAYSEALSRLREEYPQRFNELLYEEKKARGVAHIRRMERGRIRPEERVEIKRRIRKYRTQTPPMTYDRIAELLGIGVSTARRLARETNSD